MATVKERVAYLRGLMQGSGIGQNPNEQQVWNELLGIMEQIGDQMEQLESGHEELGEYLDAVDEDLAELENDIYELEDDDLIAVECPHCSDLVYIDSEEIFEGDDDADYELICPNCDESFFVSEEDLLISCPCCEDFDDEE